jgi:hypothetical protein
VLLPDPDSVTWCDEKGLTGLHVDSRIPGVNVANVVDAPPLWRMGAGRKMQAQCFIPELARADLCVAEEKSAGHRSSHRLRE